ncbi:molybdenum cofactor synthesis protein [Salinarchaeum sp. Harcht-Bsk1]|uniref:molybdopterin molybdotransferase MoeA n=1 Tax=Salinarchaeum sp. Harcht-Bsk1 TaxID=1333523 RepID=UPI0003422F5F|nr:gephyrin-like molybdotransferase Glp [Salinarchaeum sp. Harcht-Bsk1]AGN01306.1 molybdenum cofactor synthesis protein [Salinarchaeum sp. Harcht-Bsk1]
MTKDGTDATGDGADRRVAGFQTRTPLDEARKRLAEHVEPLADAEQLAIGRADGRVLATPVGSSRDVPHYRRAAMDGYALRSEDAAGASARSPAVLDAVEPDEREPSELPPGAARRVHTGSAIPDAADAVVPIERAAAIGSEIELTDPLAPGENVAPVGEDVSAGQALYEPGHRLRPSDLGLLKAAGIEAVSLRRQPTVGVVPTGVELVQHDPAPGQAVETNGLTVSRLVGRWGARAEYRNVVTDDPDALRAAIQRDLTKDVIVTTGGTSVGQRDLLPEVLDDLGEVLVHGVALQPGHPVCLGVVEETPVLCLPGYPVSCIVTAVQFLRPVLHWLTGTEPEQPPTKPATLTRKIESEPGTRTFARAELDAEDGRQVARPTRTKGAGVLSSVALADGWIEIEPDVEGLPEGDLVAVQDWEWHP